MSGILFPLREKNKRVHCTLTQVINGLKLGYGISINFTRVILVPFCNQLSKNSCSKNINGFCKIPE